MVLGLVFLLPFPLPLAGLATGRISNPRSLSPLSTSSPFGMFSGLSSMFFLLRLSFVPCVAVFGLSFCWSCWLAAASADGSFLSRSGCSSFASSCSRNNRSCSMSLNSSSFISSSISSSISWISSSISCTSCSSFSLSSFLRGSASTRACPGSRIKSGTNRTAECPVAHPAQTRSFAVGSLIRRTTNPLLSMCRAESRLWCSQPIDPPATNSAAAETASSFIGCSCSSTSTTNCRSSLNSLVE
mmetsp:Transcript_13852/g.29138  ORF Transcript_13852/g.29138 Transcript_13852/m.29138 type:complete len:243 (+) Transcript_13852:2129-2857(+)